MIKCLEIINSYTKNLISSPEMPIEEIEHKSKSLGIRFPKALIEFYKRFGNNEKVLYAFFEFKKLEDFEIYNNALLFCYGHQRHSLIGIPLDKINEEDPSIAKTFIGKEKWYNEARLSSTFFVNVACWQVVNSMHSVAKVKIVEDHLERKIKNHLQPISQEKTIFSEYELLSYYNKEKEVLASYLIETEELYVASEKDSFLNKFAKEAKMDLDWL